MDKMDSTANQPSQQAVITQPVSVSGADHLDLSELHRTHPERYPFLLESVAKGALGQYDILFAFPQQTHQLDDPDGAEAFLSDFRQAWSDQQRDRVECDLPFYGGWFAYFSYDYAQVVEPSLNLPESRFPLARLTRVPAAIVRNHQTGTLSLVAEPAFADCLAEMEKDIQAACAVQEPVAHTEIRIQASHEEPDEKYLRGVETIKEYILAGDVFQVNLSREWQVTLDETTHYLDIYHALRRHNPAPFAALAHFAPLSEGERSWQVISSSPERLVKYRVPWVETRPIAGTRKRGSDQARDKALIEELISHPKERAEHIMLIDLERNDLGRISRPGTVEVNELMGVETYEHVHHIVSNVRGQLKEGVEPLDIVHALFPGGTITGCPKVRCMEIIAELEQMPREAYTGSLGYINVDGSLDLNILIRTMIHHRHDGMPKVQFRAGAGVVADSDPQNELTETRHKAKGLIHALSGGE